MIRINLSIVAALAVLTAIIVSAPAQAQNGTLTRSFVSSSGLDTNACTITAPCASFAQAYTKIGANGIIAALDPGKYGPITIQGPVTINGNGWAAITAPAQGTGITINAGSGNVILTGLEVDGAGAGATGIAFDGGGVLRVKNSFIRGFSTAGVLFSPTASSALLVSNTLVSDSTYGIRVLPTGLSAFAQVTLNDDELSNNGTGFAADPRSCNCDGTPVDAAIINTLVANNSNIGVLAIADPGSSVIGITGSAIVYNGTGLYAGGDSTDGSNITIGLSTLRGNNSNFYHCFLYCQINSFGNNMILPTGNGPAIISQE